MACKESICRNCFHSYVCEQFNENKDDNNEKCHFANDHYIPRADVVPKSEVVVASVILEISKMLKSSYNRKHAFVNDEFLRGRDGAYQEFIDILTEISRKNAEGEK